MPPIMPEPNYNVSSGIKHLHFFNTELNTLSISKLRDFLIKKPLMETIGFENCKFENKLIDFKKIMEGIRMGAKIRKVTIGGFAFDNEAYGKIMGGLLTDGKQIKEL